MIGFSHAGIILRYRLLKYEKNINKPGGHLAARFFLLGVTDFAINDIAVIVLRRRFWASCLRLHPRVGSAPAAGHTSAG